MKNRYFLLSLFAVAIATLIFLFSAVSAQQKKSDAKNAELQELRKEIEEIERELKNVSKEEKKAFELIECYNKQVHLLNKLISSLNDDAEQSRLQIENLQNNLQALEGQMNFLKDSYARYVVAVYKLMNKSTWLYLLNAHSFSEAMMRYKFLSTFSKQGEKDIAKINNTKLLISRLTDSISAELQIRESIIREKENEERSYLGKVKEKKVLISKLKNNKEALKKELEAKKKAEQKIKQLIAELIKKENEKKKESARKKPTTKKPTSTPVETKEEKFPSAEESPYSSKYFASFRGKLHWPVSSGTIIRKFGENKNTKLNTVTVNYGIDIKVTKDFSVFAVADGVVSAIDWLPGYGTIVIITHSDDHRTVYGHIDAVNVAEGSKIKSGKKIGSVAESLEGHILHFELWNERQSQNPEIWLARK